MAATTDAKRQRTDDADAYLNRLIVESAVDFAIITIDLEGCVTSWSEGAERILGWPEEEIVGLSADLFFTKDDVEADRPETEMRIATQTGRAEDVRWHVRKDGQRFWANGMMVPLTATTRAVAVPEGAKGTPAFLKIFRDQTEKLVTEQKLESLEARVAIALSGSVAIGVWDYDIARDIVIADAPCAALYGVDPMVARDGTSADVFFDGIHPDDRERVGAALAATYERGTEFDAVYRLAVGGTRPRWVHARGMPQRDTEGRVARLPGIVTDVTAQREEAAMQAALDGLGDQLRDLRDASAISAVASKMLGETLGVTRAGYGYVGSDEAMIDVTADWTSDGAVSLVGTHRWDDFGEFADEARAGHAVVIQDARADERVADPGPLERVDTRALVNVPLMSGGRLKAVLFLNDALPRVWTEAEIAFARSVLDRTDAAIDRAEAEAERRLLAEELSHRMKNVLAVASAVATQCIRHAGDLGEAQSMVSDRLAAIGRAQDVLTQNDRDGADIRDVIGQTLAPHISSPERVRLDGPPVRLDAGRTLGLTLALHELATNASKHGAFAADGGAAAITWTNTDEGFALTWEESGGPTVRPLGREGFGSTILNRVVGGYFEGASEARFPPSGAVFTLSGTKVG